MQTTRRTLVIVCCLVIAAISLACKRTPHPRTDEPLTQSYNSPNGMITVRYPASFAASVIGRSSLQIARHMPGGHDEAVYFVPTETPITSDVNEFARVVGLAVSQRFNAYTTLSSQPSNCLMQSGIEERGEWTSVSTNTRMSHWACRFMRNGHGYSVSWIVPRSEADVQEPILHRIAQSTVFNR